MTGDGTDVQAQLLIDSYNTQQKLVLYAGNSVDHKYFFWQRL